MPTTVTTHNLRASSVDILNAIRNSASANYRDYVPEATQDASSVRDIGAIIMDYPNLQNEFLTALVNRIGRVILTSKMYNNPWSVFKKGMIEFGETIEEIFVNIAKPFEYDPAVAENKVFKREKPDVRSAFHILNYQKFYKTTVQENDLRQAFLNIDGVSNLISKITQALYVAANYDEFQTMKYMVARHILNGELYPYDLTGITAVAPTVVAIKELSNNFEFMTDEYNVAGVYNHSEKNDQFLIVNSAFDAQMDVEVLAAAFHMDKAEFAGHRVLVDSFGKLDTKRLNELFAEDSSYVALTQEELTALDMIPAILVDREWFMIFDNLFNFTDQYNGEGLYWNYWNHVWKTFSVSPFANAAVFVPGTPSVTSITVSPAAVSAMAGMNVMLYATVATENFAPKSVDWSVDATAEAAGVKVSRLGMVTIPADFSESSITVTATSTFDETVTATVTITIVSGT